MNPIINKNRAKKLIESQGFYVNSIEKIDEGNKHYLFDVVLNSGEKIVARFGKHKLKGYGTNVDWDFQGTTSLEREKNLCSLVRTKAKLPAPKTRGPYQKEGAEFLLAEKMPGKLWHVFLKENNYSLEKYLRSLEMLGGDLAKLHNLKFNSFGNIIEENKVDPPGIFNFADREKEILLKNIKNAEDSGAFSKNELGKIEKYLLTQLEENYSSLEANEVTPSFIMTDLHPANFLVDASGKATGYFDIETSQAGHPSMEMFALNFTIFNYFDGTTFEKARERFFEGYTKKGGKYPFENQLNITLEKILCMNKCITCVVAYNGVKDGIRDNWGKRLKDVLFESLEEDINYAEISDVFRSKTKQPRYPTLP